MCIRDRSKRSVVSLLAACATIIAVVLSFLLLTQSSTDSGLTDNVPRQHRDSVELDSQQNTQQVSLVADWVDQ